MAKSKEVFTTGQVARICNVAPRTVSKWFDSGQLRGYRIPGSRDRRIPVNHLITFLKAHGMPLNGLEMSSTRVLVLDTDEALAKSVEDTLSANGAFSVNWARSAFEAGVSVESLRPDVLVINVALPAVQAEQIRGEMRTHPELHGVKLIAADEEMTDAKGQAMLQSGFHAYLKKPFTAEELAETINKVVDR